MIMTMIYPRRQHGSYGQYADARQDGSARSGHTPTPDSDCQSAHLSRRDLGATLSLALRSATSRARSDIRTASRGGIVGAARGLPAMWTVPTRFSRKFSSSSTGSCPMARPTGCRSPQVRSAAVGMRPLAVAGREDSGGCCIKVDDGLESGGSASAKSIAAPSTGGCSESNRLLSPAAPGASTPAVPRVENAQ